MSKRVSWKHYNQALKQRGSIIFWMKKADQKAWYASDHAGRGRPKVYSDSSIMAALVIRTVFGLALRQCQGFMNDVLSWLGMGAVCPDYTTISRRSVSLKVSVKAYRKGPLHVVFDSTGLKVYGEGEWKVKKHGCSYHRGWRKVHMGIDPITQQIVVGSLSDKKYGDAQAMPELLDEISGEILDVLGDGAYDAKKCYRAIRQRGGRAIIPPKKGAVISSKPELVDRNQAVDRIRNQKRGKRRWKKEVDYHRRSLVETTMYRLKQITGRRMRSRKFSTQATELAIRIYILNETMKEIRSSERS